MLRKALLIAAALLAAAPAFAQRGRGGENNNRGGERHDNRGGDRNDNRGGDNRGGNRGGGDRHDNDRGGNRGGGNWNDNKRGPDWRPNDHRDNNWNNNWGRNDYRHDRSRTTLSLGFLFGSPGYSAPYYDNYSYRAPAYYNEWGLAPGQCRWDREFAYWYNRPADVEVRRCADPYGAVYVVQGSERLWRYR